MYVLYNLDMPDEPSIPVTEARAQLADLVNRVAYTGEQITLTRHGRAMAVLVSVAHAKRARAGDQETTVATVSSLPTGLPRMPGSPEHPQKTAARSTAAPPRSGGPQPPGGATC